MAKTSPGEFIRQVRAEARQGGVADVARKPSRTAIFVAIMMVILAVFFLGIDQLFGWVMRWLLDSGLMLAPTRSKENMARWYIIHAYSGFENKVRDSIISEAERLGLSQAVEAVEVPTETVTEVKRGKKVQVERKFMPGYVLAKLTLTDDVYHLVKNTPKVTGFLGAGGKPQPISEREAARYFGGVAEAKATPQAAGQRRLRHRRPGQGARRAVRELQRRGRGARFRQEEGQGRVSIFGRATPVELDFEQVELVK